MTRTTPPLQQHLLTRSDLARMGVPAAQILAWLAASAIEQVGSLGEPDAEDPVFTVAAGLRAELTARLARIGKTTVVLSPLRVRSFLLRAMLPSVRDVATVLPGVDTTATDAKPEPDLAEVLQEAALRIEADVDAVLQLAAEEAQLEVQAATVVENPPADAGEAAPAPTAETTNAPETCFAFEDLAAELDCLLGEEPVATPSPIDAEDTAPLAEPAVAELTSVDAEPWTTAEESSMDPETDTITPDSAAPTATESAVAVAASTEAAAAEVAAKPAAPSTAVAELDAAAVTARPFDDWPVAAAAPAAADAKLPTSTDRLANASTAAADAVLSAAVATTQDAMQRVESFLDQLKGALVEMAQRPAVTVAPPAPVTVTPLDVAPLVSALQQGFDRSTQQSATTSAALTALTERLSSIGQHVERGFEQAVAGLRRESGQPERHATELVITRSDRTPIVMFGLATLVMAWAALFWFKTGSTRLAIGTLIGANVVGCCLLVAWRRRV